MGVKTKAKRAVDILKVVAGKNVRATKKHFRNCATQSYKLRMSVVYHNFPK